MNWTNISTIHYYGVLQLTLQRLGFSCAIFGPEGGLVANAPHIPVHLGSMQYAIKYQPELRQAKSQPGDAAGTHLPDITVITPVFHEGETVFYAASHGHLADILGAGITAMSLNSKQLWDGANRPGCSATRNINHNLNDLKTQVNANKKGISLVEKLFEEYGKDFLDNSSKEFIRNINGKPLEAIDYIDDGTLAQLKITIDGDKGEGYFDFIGTGPETYGTINTHVSISYSCVIYVLRCLINLNIPLNQGFLEPCHIYIPKNTILNTSVFVTICGGTISGQRITDVILKCIGLCAASQGGGKYLFSDKVLPGFAIVEVLGGGVGALEGHHGASATNSPLRVSILSEGRTYEPYGLKGGKPGGRGLNLWYRKQQIGEHIATKLDSKEIIDVHIGDRVQINTPGGGGYDNPELLCGYH